MKDKHDMIARKQQTWAIRQQTEIGLRVPFDLAALSSLFATLAKVQNDIVAWYCHSNHDHVSVSVVACNDGHTARQLQLAGFECTPKPVFVIAPISNSDRALQLRATLRAAGINILADYSGRDFRNGSVLVLQPADGLRAAEVLAANHPPGAPPPPLPRHYHGGASAAVTVTKGD